jgi:hypothetical protein
VLATPESHAGKLAVLKQRGDEPPLGRVLGQKLRCDWDELANVKPEPLKWLLEGEKSVLFGFF